MPKNPLEINEEEVYKQIEKELGKTKIDINNDTQILREWLKGQPHLPEVPDDNVIRSFILFNKFSIERAKQKLDMYYTIRSIVPDFFNKHPCSSEMIQQAKISMVVPLPILSEDKRRVIYTKFSEDFGADAFLQDHYLAHTFNIMELLIRYDCFLGAHHIFDCAGFKLGHATKINPVGMKKSTVVMEKVFSNRVASIHLINFHPFMESPLNMVKVVLPEKIRNRIHIHTGSEALFNIFPKKILPKDIGGEEDSLAVLSELWAKKFQENKTLFDKLTTMRVDESKRPTKLVNDEVLGFYGNFKKLEVD